MKTRKFKNVRDSLYTIKNSKHTLKGFALSVCYLEDIE